MDDIFSLFLLTSFISANVSNLVNEKNRHMFSKRHKEYSMGKTIVSNMLLNEAKFSSILTKTTWKLGRKGKHFCCSNSWQFRGSSGFHENYLWSNCYIENWWWSGLHWCCQSCWNNMKWNNSSIEVLVSNVSLVDLRVRLG